MIQFNLLPDVKIEFIRARRVKRLVIVITSAVAAFAVGAMATMFLIVNVLQKNHIENTTTDIRELTGQIHSINNIDKMLTVQNQLNKITQLHDEKPVSSRLVNYLAQITPADLTIARLSVNFEESRMSFTGAASTLTNINRFVDTLKFTTYQSGDARNNAFSGVVLESFGRDDRGASYQVNLTFDPIIFSSESDVRLVVPNITTTRSSTLFLPLSNPEEQPQALPGSEEDF